MRLPPLQGVLAAAGLAAAAAIAYAATRSAGPLPPVRYTEDLAGPLVEHVVTEAELLVRPVLVPVRFPARIGHEITSVIHYGYAPGHALPDPVAAALPAEQG